jgi:hypothetical protein
MSLITNRWVHGTIVEAENPVEFVVRRGWGTHFGVREATKNWFHFPITTLSTFGTERLRLVRVYVFYRTDGAEIRELHVYDGPRRVEAFSGMNFSGDHSGAIDDWNCWTIQPAVEIFYGIGISLGVSFTQDENIGMSEILFTTVGAAFETP